MLFARPFCVECMQDALQAPVRLDCGPDVGRVRQRCYRVRQSCRARGNFSLDCLSFVLEGSTLVIKKRPVSPLRQLRQKFAMLKEMRDIVERSAGSERKEK